MRDLYRLNVGVEVRASHSVRDIQRSEVECEVADGGLVRADEVGESRHTPHVVHLVRDSDPDDLVGRHSPGDADSPDSVAAECRDVAGRVEVPACSKHVVVHAVRVDLPGARQGHGRRLHDELEVADRHETVWAKLEHLDHVFATERHAHVAAD